jgi:2-methylcitrate dehydratase PrpD
LSSTAVPGTGTVQATRILAEWVAGGHSLPAATRSIAGRCVLDWLGAGFAGLDLPPATIAARLATRLGGPAESALLAGRRVACTGAALANGIASHAAEMDDLHRESVMHLGTVTIPAALALAERGHCSGHTLLTAIVCGYEVGARVAEAAGGAHYHFWHVTGTAGAFAAAAASAVVLKLNAGETLHALGTAGTLAAGLWEFLSDGAMSKTLHAGRAAEAGVLSALLAEGGFTGAGAILEGNKGFLQAMAGGGNPRRLTDGLGDGYRIDQNSFKIHAACGHTHAAIDAALAVRARGIEPASIEAVHVGTFRTALEVTGIRSPENPYQAKFSLPWCVALALVRGHVALGDFAPELLRDSVVRGVADRVVVEEVPAYTRAFPVRWPASVGVRMAKGQRLDAVVEFPRGTPEHPATDDELVQKFSGLCARWLTAERRDALVRAVGALDQVPDVAGIPWGSDANDPS